MKSTKAKKPPPKKQVKNQKPVEGDEIVQLKHSTSYYSDYKTVQWAIILFQLGVIGCLGLLLIVQLITRPPTIHFFENAKGQIITPQPLNTPGMSSSAINNWIIEGIMAGYHFNFKSVDQAIEHLYDYFTEPAVESFKESLQQLGIIDTVVKLKMIAEGQALGAPEVLNEGVINGRYSWQVRIPIQIIMSNQIRQTATKLDVELLVVRVPELVSPMGVLVEKYSAKQIGVRMLDSEKLHL